MAIIDLQRRIAEVGRIRIGQQIPIHNTNKTRPAKLETFRLTSPDRQRITAAANLYGGDVHPWKAPAGNQYEVITNTDTIPVLVPPADMAFTQWYELWSRGGCQRRCDGRTETLTEGPCQCDPDHRECAIHTRLSVLLRDVPGLGVWRIDTKGYYAAVELAGAVDILKLAAERGQIIPATLRLDQRVIVRPGVGTRRFAVPVLDPQISLGELWSGATPSAVNHDAPALEDRPVISFQTPSGLRTEYADQPSPTADPLEAAGRLARTVADQIDAIEATRQPPDPGVDWDHPTMADVPKPDAPLTAPTPRFPTPTIAEQVDATNQPTEPRRRGAVPLRVTGLAPRTTTNLAAATPALPTDLIASMDPDWPEDDDTDQDDEPDLSRQPGPGQMAMDVTPAPKLISDRQHTKLMTLLRKAGFEDHEARNAFLSEALLERVESTRSLTADQGNRALDILEHGDKPPTKTK